MKVRPMPLDRAAVAHIAMLARIKVPDGELDAIARELDGIIHWVEQLQEVDTADVEPMTGAVRIALPRRRDEITDGNCRDRVLANGPETVHGFFVVPKVIE
jgi:aspartyl-tRNA(Asn)/glutamyl-tRNA(Gln) amidotransferase subunit C